MMKYGMVWNNVSDDWAPTDSSVNYLSEAEIHRLNLPVASLPVVGFRRLYPRYVLFFFWEALSGRTKDCLCSIFLNLQIYGTCLIPWITMESDVWYAVGSSMLPTRQVGNLYSFTMSVFTSLNLPISLPRTKPWPRLSSTPCNRDGPETEQEGETCPLRSPTRNSPRFHSLSLLALKNYSNSYWKLSKWDSPR